MADGDVVEIPSTAIVLTKNCFEDRNYLMVACYLCDSEGVELESVKDYKEKGTCLKIRTEIVKNEVSIGKNKKRYAGEHVDEFVYYIPNLYKGYLIDLTKSGSQSDAEIANVMEFFNNQTNPLTIESDEGVSSIQFSNTMENTARSDDNNSSSFVRSVSITINELTDKDIIGYRSKVFLSDISMQYLQDCGYGSDDFYDVVENLWNKHHISSDHAVFSNNGSFFRIDITTIERIARTMVFRHSLVNPLTDEITINDGNPNKYHYSHISDCFCKHDDYEYDPLVEVDKPDNMRKPGQISELYNERTPSFRYRADDVSGLNKVILNILNDPNLKVYKITKLIIGDHLTPVLEGFPKKKYTIAEKTYQLMFNRFSDIEINNNSLTIIFPQGNLSVKKLKIVNGTILSNNTIIKIEEDLSLENCTFDNYKEVTTPSHTVFNVSKSVKIDGLIISDIIKLSFITEKPDITGDFSNISFKMSYDNIKYKGSFLILTGFTTLNILDIDALEAELPSNPLIHMINCITVSITGMKSKYNFNKNFITAVGFDELNIGDCEITNTSRTGCFLNISSVTEEATIAISKTNLSCNKFINLVKSKVGEFKVSDCNLKFNKFISMIDSSINKVVSNKGTVDCDEFRLNKIDFSYDSTIITSKICSISAKLSGSFNKASIICDSLTLTTEELAKMSAIETIFEATKCIFTSVDNNKSKLDFTKSSMIGDILEVKNILDVSFGYCYFMSVNNIMSDIDTISFTEGTIRINSVRKFELSNIKTVKNSEMLIYNGPGNLKFNTYDIDKIGLKFSCYSDVQFIRDTINTKSNEVYVRTADTINYKVKLTSNNCSSSFIGVENKKDLIISSSSKDFKIFKSADDNFNTATGGRGLYKEIIYKYNK